MRNNEAMLKSSDTSKITKKTIPARRGYAGRSAEQLRAERRARLIDSALELFGTHGYHQTAIERLCAHAKVATRHFYEAFPSREDLLLATFDHVVARTQAAIGKELSNRHTDTAHETTHEIADQSNNNTTGDPVERAIMAFTHSFLHDERHARIVTLQATGVSETMDRHRRKTMHGFAAVIEAYVNWLAGAGKMPERDYHLSCLALVGAVNELVIEYLTAELPPSVDTIANELLLLFKSVIRGARLPQS